jgi:hypothetical protein
MNAILIPIVVFLAVFVVPFVATAWVLIYLIKSRTKVRTALINQGIPFPLQRKPAPNKYTSLRNACLFIALAIGLIAGLAVDFQLNYSDTASLLIMLSSVTLFTGFGYLVFFLLVRTKNMDEE